MSDTAAGASIGVVRAEAMPQSRLFHGFTYWQVLLRGFYNWNRQDCFCGLTVLR